MALRRGLVDLHSHMPVSCTGGLQFGNRFFKCWNHRGHGSLDLIGAVAQSCDVYFYQLGLKLGPEKIVEMARAAGIHGFCYYHYWFNSRRILERPFYEVLASGRPDFPFCLCWANENWTKAWDGGDKHILLEQKYGHEDDLAHIENLIPAFHDRRYIRVNGKPLFLVYRTELLPNPAQTAQIWRKAARRAGLGDLYLARVENFTQGVDPRTIGFDAFFVASSKAATTARPTVGDAGITTT